MEIEIREAKIDDGKNLLQFMKIVGGETDNLTFGSEGMPFSLEEEVAFIERKQNSENEVMYLALTGDEIVGDASIAGYNNRMRHRANLGISVAKKCWNMGIGSMLMEHIISYCKSHDIEQIDLEVRCDNTSAIALYKKYGFEVFGTYPGYFKMGEDYIDFYYMVLQLKKIS